MGFLQAEMDAGCAQHEQELIIIIIILLTPMSSASYHCPVSKLTMC